MLDNIIQNHSKVKLPNYNKTNDIFSENKDSCRKARVAEIYTQKISILKFTNFILINVTP